MTTRIATQPKTPLGIIAKEAARFGWNATELHDPNMEWEDDEWGENGFSQEIQNEAPYIMWDHIAMKVIEAYTAQDHDPNP